LDVITSEENFTHIFTGDETKYPQTSASEDLGYCEWNLSWQTCGSRGTVTEFQIIVEDKSDCCSGADAPDPRHIQFNVDHGKWILVALSVLSENVGPGSRIR
jgi:hypothetical protein